MKIENEKRHKLFFIKTGEVFEYNDIFYLKTNKIVGTKRTCVALDEGIIAEFDENDFVYKCETTVIIE